MHEGVRLRIIDTPVPLTCFPIKLISFCQFISEPLLLELHQSLICSGEINKSQISSIKGLLGDDGPGAQGRPTDLTPPEWLTAWPPKLQAWQHK